MNDMMKAIVLREHGEPDVLQFESMPLPAPKPGEVLVKLAVVSLNRMDLFVRKGWPGIRLEYPHILGADGAGIVVGLGKNTTGFGIGSRVVINPNLSCGECGECLARRENRCQHWHLLGETVPGTYREFIAIPARQLLRVPDDFDLHQAAAAALVFETAWHSLVDRGQVQAGDKVLVVGASGGVNMASIQIAQHFGAEVFVVGSNKHKLELASSLGADHLIDRSSIPEWYQDVYALSGKTGMDIVVDNVGATFSQSIRTLRTGGRLLTVGNTVEPNVTFDNRYVFSRHSSILGSTMGTNRNFREVMQLVFDGKLHVPHRTYPWQQVAEAHHRLESGEQLGKITLAIKEDK